MFSAVAGHFVSAGLRRTAPIPLLLLDGLSSSFATSFRSFPADSLFSNSSLHMTASGAENKNPKPAGSDERRWIVTYALLTVFLFGHCWFRLRSSAISIRSQPRQ